jgi:hypothetical protein
MLIVNSTVYGRSGGSVGVFSRAPQAQEIALHELGHLVPFRLAGEYDTLPAAGRRRSRHLLRSRAPRTERHQGVESRLHQVARPHRIRNAGAGDDQPGLHPVRPAAEPGTRGHGERLRGSQILPLWTVPPRVPLQNVRTRQAVLRGLPAQDPPGAPTKVPLVRELSAAVAASRVDAALLTPKFTGPTGTGAWVWHQSPAGGSVRAPGTTVTLQTRTGPIP